MSLYNYLLCNMELLGQKTPTWVGSNPWDCVRIHAELDSQARSPSDLDATDTASVFPQKTREKKLRACARARASNGDERMGQAGGPHLNYPSAPGILITSRSGSVRSHTILRPHQGTTSSATQHRSGRLPSPHHWTGCVRARTARGCACFRDGRALRRS
jgi:hypothetical protein